jgi:nitrite reductase/ring-hydroxylating ferredoxin subunit
MNRKRLTRDEVASILADGAHYVLEDYALRDELQAKIRQAFLEGIEALAGAACRSEVEAHGLRELHRYFPLAKIHKLEAHLMRSLQDELYYWSYRVGADTLGLAHPFFVDHFIIFRIHYPFLLARDAGAIEPAPIVWKERMRLAYGALRDWDALKDYVGLGRGPADEKVRSVHDAFAYHGDIPAPARSHGPHMDTWYGHSYDGINLWLSIDGVNVDNTVILYPDMFGRPLEFDPVTMYIARGQEICKPLKVEIGAGDLLVFNPEMLHGTQVNISDVTRVALTTRINPGQPRFGVRASAYMEHWYRSEDVERREFSRPRRFPHDKYRGEQSVRARDRYPGNRTMRLAVEGEMAAGRPIPVCSAQALARDLKIAVDIGKHKLIVWRAAGELRAFGRLCPHLGIDLADGYHDERDIYCPGHGIAYSLTDGRSKCAAFGLREYRAFERDGTIYVERIGNEAGSKPAGDRPHQPAPEHHP